MPATTAAEGLAQLPYAQATANNLGANALTALSQAKPDGKPQKPYTQQRRRPVMHALTGLPLADPPQPRAAKRAASGVGSAGAATTAGGAAASAWLAGHQVPLRGAAAAKPAPARADPYAPNLPMAATPVPLASAPPMGVSEYVSPPLASAPPPQHVAARGLPSPAHAPASVPQGAFYGMQLAPAEPPPPAGSLPASWQASWSDRLNSTRPQHPQAPQPLAAPLQYQQPSQPSLAEAEMRRAELAAPASNLSRVLMHSELARAVAAAAAAPGAAALGSGLESTGGLSAPLAASLASLVQRSHAAALPYPGVAATPAALQQSLLMSSAAPPLQPAAFGAVTSVPTAVPSPLGTSPLGPSAPPATMPPAMTPAMPTTPPQFPQPAPAPFTASSAPSGFPSAAKTVPRVPSWQDALDAAAREAALAEHAERVSAVSTPVFGNAPPSQRDIGTAGRPPSAIAGPSPGRTALVPSPSGASGRLSATPPSRPRSPSLRGATPSTTGTGRAAEPYGNPQHSPPRLGRSPPTICAQPLTPLPQPLTLLGGGGRRRIANIGASCSDGLMLLSAVSAILHPETSAPPAKRARLAAA